MTMCELEGAGLDEMLFFLAAQMKGSCLTSKPLFWIVEKERPNLPPARSPSKTSLP